MDKDNAPGLPGKNSLPENEKVIPVIEEYYTIEKEIVESGRVNVRKQVTEIVERIEVPLLHDEYKVEHIAVNRMVEGEPPTMRQEGDSTFIPVLREVLVKRTMLVEEIKITRRTVETSEPQDIRLRKESVTVQRSEQQK